MNNTHHSSASQWMLFGYDMRRIGRHWMGAWQDLLYSNDSPLRRRFDEPVWLVDGTHGAESTVYQGGAVVGGDMPVDGPHCEALLVPEELVLSRQLTIPLAAESELASVIDLEAAANSPFPGDDTVVGWQEQSRDASDIRISLVIASRLALSAWLAQRSEKGDAPTTESGAAPELWAQAHGAMVTLRGFGEERRTKAYRSRLLRCLAIAFSVLLLLLLVASLFAFQQGAALERGKEQLAAMEQQSRKATAARTALAEANALITAANAVVEEFPNPHVELARLTQLLGDDAFIVNFSMRGRTLRIRGRATDAAGVMQTLAEQPAFSSVTAPQAITALGNTGVQQFYLDIDLAEAVGPGKES